MVALQHVPVLHVWPGVHSRVLWSVLEPVHTTFWFPQLAGVPAHKVAETHTSLKVAALPSSHVAPTPLAAQKERQQLARVHVDPGVHAREDWSTSVESAHPPKVDCWFPQVAGVPLQTPPETHLSLNVVGSLSLHVVPTELTAQKLEQQVPVLHVDPGVHGVLGVST